MSNEQYFTILSIAFTAINVAISFSIFKYNRKKDFQDKLFQIKLDAYKELNEICYETLKRLDINSTPFVQIYDFTNKEEWVEYCEKEMGEQIVLSFALKDFAYKYSLVLPTKILDQFNIFTNASLSFITMSYHFDTGYIIENQQKLHDIYWELLNMYRKDLNIESIDIDLKKRLLS